MYIGIDLGTSGVKIVVIDSNQQCVASANATLSVSRPHPGWSEQNPQDWWRATVEAMDSLKKNHPEKLKQVLAIGLSGQQHGATLLDKHGHVLRPAILWNDQRAFEECDVLLKRVPHAHQITGNLIMPGFTAPKILWVKKHEPDIFQKISMILLPKDYLRYQLTGQFATDLSDASGTSWVDVEHRRYSDEMIRATEITKDQLPTLFEGSEITGKLLPKIAKIWEVPEDCVVIGGGGDNAASAISMGIIEPGSALLSLGTSGVYFISDDRYRPNPSMGMHTMCHCLPDLWHEMTVHLSAASSLTWLSQAVQQPDVSKLLDESERHVNKNTPIFLPYLSGERTPHNDPFARGVFFGLNHDTHQVELTQSVLEGVAFSFADGQRAIIEAGIKPKQISVVGGGARSLYWGKILASVLQQPLIYRQQADVGGAFGAARLAWFAMNGGDPNIVLGPPPIDHTIEPINEWVEFYEKKYELFRRVYQQLYPLFHFET